MATAADITRNAAVNGATALLNSGKIVFHTSGNSVVGTCTFGATAFGAASSGSASANAITDDTNAAGGTIAHGHLLKSDNSVVMDISVGTSGAELNISSLTVGAGDKISVSSFSLSIAAS